MVVKKRHNYVSILLVMAFVFCTISVFYSGTLPATRHQVQVTSPTLPSYAELSLCAEMGEDDHTGIGRETVTTHFLNTADFRMVYKDPGPVRMAYIHCPYSYQRLPIFIAVRTLRI
jgi:hypothetical protein